MNMRKAMVAVLVAAPMMLVGQAADAKVKDQSRDVSTVNVVGAQFGDDEVQGDLEAYETASGTFIGYFRLDGSLVCEVGDPEDPNDDLYFYYSYATFDDGSNIEEAREFTIGRRNSTAFVDGSVRVQVNVDDQCNGEGDSFEADVDVTIDLASNGARIRQSNTLTITDPDSTMTEKYSFAGSGATGTVTVVYPGDDPVIFDADGRIGTAKSTSTNRNG